MMETIGRKLHMLEVRINQMTKYMEILGPENDKTKTSLTICTYALDELHPEWGLKRGLLLKDKRPLANVIYSFNSGYGLNGSIRWLNEAIKDAGIESEDKELAIC